jgi:myo-inositol-1(or 4)-monophosphatase
MSPLDFNPESPDALRSLRTLAEDAARAGGKVARRYFGTDLGVRLKSDRSEVSEADEDAQEAVIDCIRARRPHDAFIAEEHLALAAAAAPSNALICWVIDPIDGTRNYVRRLPIYTCSVAAMYGGVPLVGAVYEPERERLYSASRSSGLFVDGEQRSTREEVPRARGLNPKPVVGLPSSPSGPIASLAHAWLDRFVCRCLGSTALQLALVAAGELDGILVDNARLWDLAAGAVLIGAAGARIAGPGGEPLFPIDVATYTDAEMPCIAGRVAVFDQLTQAP